MLKHRGPKAVVYYHDLKFVQPRQSSADQEHETPLAFINLSDYDNANVLLLKISKSREFSVKTGTALNWHGQDRGRVMRCGI